MASYLKPKPSIHTKLLIVCPTLPHSFVTSSSFPHQSLTILQDQIQVFPLRGPTAEEHPAAASTSSLPHQATDSLMEGLYLLHLPTVITTEEAGASWMFSEGPATEAGAFGVDSPHPCRDQTQDLKPARQVPTSEPHTRRLKKTSVAVCLESGTHSLKP